MHIFQPYTVERSLCSAHIIIIYTYIQYGQCLAGLYAVRSSHPYALHYLSSTLTMNSTKVQNPRRKFLEAGSGCRQHNSVVLYHDIRSCTTHARRYTCPVAPVNQSRGVRHERKSRTLWQKSIGNHWKSRKSG